MADDDFTTEQGTDYNDKVHRLVAQVAQMFGGQVPAGAFGGSPQGSPGIQQMPGGGAPMGRPPVPGFNPAVPPDPRFQNISGSMSDMPQGQPQPGQQGPMDYMGNPSSRAPMATAAGQPVPEYHTPTPPWQVPQPGGGQPGPANPNPGQPFAAYRIGDQPWMTQPITGRGGTSMSSAPVPSDQYAAQAKPQKEASVGPSAADTFGPKPMEPPNLPEPTLKDAEKFIMKLRPGSNTAQIQSDLPKAYDFLLKKYYADRKMAGEEFKENMAIVKEQRMQQSTDARIKHAQDQITHWQQQAAAAKNEKDRQYALEQGKQWTGMYKTILGGQISAAFLPAGADKDFIESQLKGALAAEGPAPGGTQGSVPAGTVKNGYRFKGGDYKKKENWEEVDE